MDYGDLSVKSKMIISLFQTVKLSLPIFTVCKFVLSPNNYIGQECHLIVCGAIHGRTSFVILCNASTKRNGRWATTYTLF